MKWKYSDEYLWKKERIKKIISFFFFSFFLYKMPSIFIGQYKILLDKNSKKRKK